MQVGIVQYSATPTVIFFLNSYSDKGSLVNAVSNLQYNTGSSQTANIGQALNVAQNNQFIVGNGDRLSVPNIAIVITSSGDTINSASAAAQAQALRQSGTIIVTVGITPATSGAIVQQIASLSSLPQALGLNYFLTQNQNSLTNLIDLVGNQTCYDATSDCGNRIIDLVFVLGATSNVQGSWSNILTFVNSIVNGLSISSSGVHVGVTTFSDNAQNPILLNTFTDKGQLMNAISSLSFLGGGSNLYSGLTAAQTTQFTTSNGDRSGVRNVVVFITGSASSTNNAQVIPAARLLEQQSGAKIYAIGATTNVNITEIVNIASAPHIQYHQWWYTTDFNTAFTNIVGALERELCRADLGKSIGGFIVSELC